MCFGGNSDYELGIANGGSKVLYATELDVTFPSGSVAVSAHVGSYTGYAVMIDDSVYSWGKNSELGLGDGSSASTIIGNSAEPARKVDI